MCIIIFKGKPAPKRGGGVGVPRVRRAKPGFSRSRGSRSVRQPERMDFDFSFLRFVFSTSMLYKSS